MGSSRLIRSRIRAAYLAALLLFLAAPGAGAQDLAAALPLNPEIRTGTLPNGLTYFIRQNDEPNDRAMLRLAVKAGSIDEAADQRGLAHVLEHMAFNGTARFEPGELIAYLQSIGAQFGPHVNAYTSFDETVYMLSVPTDREGVLGRGLEALADFAGGITLDPDEIERERGVVIEEWRRSLGANTRMQEPQIRALFGDSKYADRLPIGTPDVLKSFTPERLRAFYRDYYRPDRMAVVVVGEIDPAAIEQQIRTLFGALPVPAPGTRDVYPIPPHADTRYVSLSDVEAQASSATVYHKRPRVELRTVADYRTTVVAGLLYQIVNARMSEMARAADAPFLAASAGGDTLGRTAEAFAVSARARDGELTRALEALGRELARLRQHGVGEAELERAKATTLARYERAYNERDNAESGPLADELVRHFLEGEAAPGIEAEVALVRRFLPTITADEVAALARRYITEENRVVLATQPEKAEIAAVSETDLRTALREGLSASVEPWSDAIEGRELLASAPVPGRVTGRREIPEIGVTVLTLSNGVEVWLKPTDFRNDQITFTSYARGGVSLAPPEDYFDASLSTSLVGLSGVGGLSPVDLSKLLAGKLANVSPSLSTYTHGMSGSTTPRDLETALQLLYLYFTAPNRDPAAFALLQQRLAASVANQEQNPGVVFSQTVRRINTDNHYTARPLRLDDVKALDAATMQAFYERLFANAADFTFFFTGAFQVDTLVPLLERYVASLPSTGSPTSKLVDLDLRFPGAPVRETVYKGQEPQSQTVIAFFADTALDELETHRLQAAADVLENRLRDILREQLGGTYSVGVGYSSTSPVPGYGTVTVQYGSSPENVETLTAAVMAEVERLRTEGPTAEDVQAVKEAEKNSIRESLRENGYWQASLMTMHLLGRDARQIPQRLARADGLDQENIHAAIRKYLTPDRYTVITLMPEAK